MLKKKPIIIANWKMYKNRMNTEVFFEHLIKNLSSLTNIRILIAPPFTLLKDAVRATYQTLIEIGAQNISEKEEGAFTGEISASMLQELGVYFVLIGHSERRLLFGDTDIKIAQKIRQALSHNLLPVLCIGETLEQREQGKTLTVLTEQLESVLPQSPCNIVIAYEPIWAIGTGKTAESKHIEEAHRFCRQLLSSIWNKKTAEETPILYGGSVNPETIKDLNFHGDIDGVLVGSASLDSKQFIQIIEGFKV